ncbi:acyl-CoA-like ligand-binding transcription factor, partial [Nocardia sp. NPDC004722]
GQPPEIGTPQVFGPIRRQAAHMHRLPHPQLRGLSPAAITFWRLIDDSPALQARVHRLDERSEAALAQALSETTGATPQDCAPRLAAAALAGLNRALHAEIRRGILAGEDPEAVRAKAIEAATDGFDTALGGLADYATRPLD